MEPHAASVGVSTVVALLLFSMLEWLELETGVPLVKSWIIVLIFVVIFIINHRMFVATNGGELFRDKFESYSEAKQAWLYFASSAFVILVVASTYFSTSEFRSAHGITN